MARDKLPGGAAAEPLAVPLREAAAILGTPAKELRRLGIKPYTTAGGVKVYSLAQLRRALGLVKSPRDARRYMRQDPPPPRPYTHRARIRT